MPQAYKGGECNIIDSSPWPWSDVNRSAATLEEL